MGNAERRGTTFMATVEMGQADMILTLPRSIPRDASELPRFMAGNIAPGAHDLITPLWPPGTAGSGMLVLDVQPPFLPAPMTGPESAVDVEEFRAFLVQRNPNTAQALPGGCQIFTLATLVLLRGLPVLSLKNRVQLEAGRGPASPSGLRRQLLAPHSQHRQ